MWHWKNCIFNLQQVTQKSADWWCCLNSKSSIREISHPNVVSQRADFQKCDSKLQTFWKMKPDQEKPCMWFYWYIYKWLLRDMWPFIISTAVVLTECDPDCSRSLCQRLLNISVSDISLLQTPHPLTLTPPASPAAPYTPNPPEMSSQLQRAFITARTSVGASQRNPSIHEKCRVSQTRPGRPFGDTRCLPWLGTGARVQGYGCL